MNKSCSGPSDDFVYVAVDGLPFVVDLKGDTTKIVDRYTIPRYVENLKTPQVLRSGYIPKERSYKRLVMIFLRYMVSS